MFTGTAEACRFVRLYFLALRGNGISVSTREDLLVWLIYKLHHFLDGGNFRSLDIEYIAGIHTHTFQGMIVNVWTMYSLRQNIKFGLASRGLLSSQYCEYFFASITQMSNSNVSAPPSIEIDRLVARAAQSRILLAHLGPKYDFLHANQPVYEEGQRIAEENLSEHDDPFHALPLQQRKIPDHHSNQLKFEKLFHFPSRSQDLHYQIKNFVPVRQYHRIKPGVQYAGLAGETYKNIKKI